VKKEKEIVLISQPHLQLQNLWSQNVISAYLSGKEKMEDIKFVNIFIGKKHSVYKGVVLPMISGIHRGSWNTFPCG
jgi:hypothetical protein